MANTLGDPQLVSDKGRENQVLSYNTTLTSEATAPNPLLRIRLGSTTLIDFPLHASAPLEVAAVDGSCAVVFASDEEVAVGGLATVPDNYQIIGRDAAVHLSGLVSGPSHITAGQVIRADSIALTAPATP